MNREQATITSQQPRRILEPKLYPKMQAIANVYEEAIRQDKDAKKINPMELWDLHHLRRLDDMGFVDALYGKQRPSDGRPGRDRDHGHNHGRGETSGSRGRPDRGPEGIVSTACDDDDCGVKH